ncbi:MAG TPA: hypothetical protein VM369_06445 [Candidatus Binatia bacterium]|nr:hypothetical protein [Candidatus Binatia bacterium]
MLLSRCLLLASLAAAGPAVAGDLSYSYGEARAVAADARGPGEARGLSLNGSLTLTRTVFAGLRYVDLGEDGDQRLGTERATLLAGMRYPFTPMVDIVGFAGVLHEAVHRPRGDDRGIGLVLGGGGRAALGSRYEASARIEYTQIFSDGITAIAGEALWHVTHQFSLLAGAEASVQERTATVGARLQF